MSGLRFREALTGISAYMPGKTIAEARREHGFDKAIKLSANENPWGSSPLVRQAILEALLNTASYPDGYCTELRDALAELHGIDATQIVFGDGSFELMSFVAEAFIEPGEESIMPAPSFGWYETVTTIMGGTAIKVPLVNHGVDLDAIRARLTDRTRVIWLCNPNNPTGTIYTGEEQAKFIASIPPEVVVVLDEAYCDYVTGDAYPHSLDLIGSYPNVIVLRTFSKVHGLAGLRIGYGVADAGVVNCLNKVRPPLNVNAIAQAAALASLGDGEFRAMCIENNTRGKKYFYRSFSGLGLEYIPTEGNFIMVNTGLDGTVVSEKLLQEGIIVRPGKGFQMPGWLRITIGRPEENELVVRGLQEVLRE